MEQISKPHIVAFLRMVDRHKWVHPRIRFASVRSKPELIADIGRAFAVNRSGDRFSFVPRAKSYRGPRIEYDLAARRYLLDGQPRDFPRESRRLPEFRIVPGPFHLNFGGYHLTQPPPDPPATCTASGT